jgi:hypothetical protein
LENAKQHITVEKGTLNISRNGNSVFHNFNSDISLGRGIYSPHTSSHAGYVRGSSRKVLAALMSRESTVSLPCPASTGPSGDVAFECSDSRPRSRRAAFPRRADARPERAAGRIARLALRAIGAGAEFVHVEFWIRLSATKTTCAPRYPRRRRTAGAAFPAPSFFVPLPAREPDARRSRATPMCPRVRRAELPHQHGLQPHIPPFFPW